MLNLNRKKVTTTLLLTMLTGCASQMAELKTIGEPPKLEQVSIPMERENYQPVDWEIEDTLKHRKYSNSLWEQGSREFFKDLKARRIGDILKVIIKIKDKAELDNATKRTRESEDDSRANTMFGLEEKILGMVPGVANPAKLLDLKATSTTNGKGTIAREEKIETEVAVMVTQILPNGNLVIHGAQEIRVNFEVREITVDGIISQEDIGADNSIESNQIAEARISYGGRGQMTNVQQPRVGTQIIDILSPF